MKSLLKKLVNIMKPKKPLSRQRIWQKKMQEQGRCVCCGEPHERKTQLCDKCAARDGTIYRHADRKAAWDKVDWTRPTKDIAAEFGVTPANVCWRRKQAGIQSPGRGRPPKKKTAKMAFLATGENKMLFLLTPSISSSNTSPP